MGYVPWISKPYHGGDVDASVVVFPSSIGNIVCKGGGPEGGPHLPFKTGKFAINVVFIKLELIHSIDFVNKYYPLFNYTSATSAVLSEKSDER